MALGVAITQNLPWVMTPEKGKGKGGGNETHNVGVGHGKVPEFRGKPMQPGS